MIEKYNIEPCPGVEFGTFHVYVHLRSEKRLVYVGLYLDKHAAMDSVRRSVGALGLRCLFYWDAEGNYRCGSDVTHVYGRITRERVDIDEMQSNEAVEPLPFDRLEMS